MYKKRAFTLVEVMISLVIFLVIAIGMMSYQYAAAIQARKTDARVTAARLASVFLNAKMIERMYRHPLDPAQYEMGDDLEKFGIGIEPLQYYAELDNIPALNGLPDSGAPVPFRHFKIFTNGAWFWVKLTYENTWPGTDPASDMPLRLFTVIVAWNYDYTDENALDYSPDRCMIISKYSKTIPADNQP